MVYLVPMADQRRHFLVVVLVSHRGRKIRNMVKRLKCVAKDSHNVMFVFVFAFYRFVSHPAIFQAWFYCARLCSPCILIGFSLLVN